MVVPAGRGRARVFGRFRPGNEVKRTLIVDGAMMHGVAMRWLGDVESEGCCDLKT